MPRPNRDRVMVSAYISRGGRDHLDQLAETYGVKRSDVLRLALSHGVGKAEAELRRRKP